MPKQRVGEKMLKNLSLRLRILLFFALLALGSIAIVALALWLSYSRLTSPELFSAFINAGIYSSFGILGLSVFIWLLFDENIAKAIEQLAANLRVNAHTDTTDEVDTKTGRYLGDLSSAAAAVTQRLSETKYQTAEEIARKTAQLETEKAHLTKVLSEIPLGVILVGKNGQVSLYDGQSAAAFENYHPLALGQPITDYFCKETLSEVKQQLSEQKPGAVQDIRLPSSDKSIDFEATVRLLEDNLGFVIVLSARDHGLAPRPLVFDFDISEHLANKQQASTNLSDLCFVIFDTETTGLSTKADDVIQIGAVRILSGQQINGEVFDTYVDPKRLIPTASTKIHGITDAMVKGAPLFTQAAKKFHAFSNNAILVAHNAPFDLAFFKREESKTGLTFDHPVLDTVLLSAAIYGQSATHTLDAIAERLNITIEEKVRHTALGDAIATAEVFLKLLPILKAQGIITLKDAQNAMRKHQRLLSVQNAD